MSGSTPYPTAAVPASTSTGSLTTPVSPPPNVVPLKSALKSSTTSPLASPPASTSSSSLPLKPQQQQQQQPLLDAATGGGFVSRVSFDSTEGTSRGGGTGISQSFTLRATTAHFQRSRESRTFLIATDLNEYSAHALNWSLDNLIEDGDEIVVLRVYDPSTAPSSSSTTTTTSGSTHSLPLPLPLPIPSSSSGSHSHSPQSSSSSSPYNIADTARGEAHLLIESVMERNRAYNQIEARRYRKNSSRSSSFNPQINDAGTTLGGEEEGAIEGDREIGITVEFVVGKVFDSITKMISVYRPDSLIVGTRARTDSVWKSAFIGSVSKYCVKYSPVPVVVIRPAVKVAKSLNRRTKRQSYAGLVEADHPPLQHQQPKREPDIAKQTADLTLTRARTADANPSSANEPASKKTGIRMTKNNTMPAR